MAEILRNTDFNISTMEIHSAEMILILLFITFDGFIRGIVFPLSNTKTNHFVLLSLKGQ